MSTILSQIDKFREKVALCTASFSLRTCAENIAEISTQCRNLSSIKSIRIFMENAPTRSNKRTRDLAVYAQWYLDNISYIRELRSNFKTRIHQPLLQHYDHLDNDQTSTKGKNLNEIAETLAQFLNSLDRLIDTENEIDSTILTIDNKMLTRKGIPKQQQNLIRLIPSALMQLDQLAILATDWLATEAEKRAEDRTRNAGQAQDRPALLGRLSRLSQEIDNGEKELEMESEELHILLEREDRSNRINGENHSLEVKMNSLQDKLSETKLQIADTEELIQTAEKNSKFKSKLLEDLRLKRRQAADLEVKIEMLQYQMGIVLEDLCVELEMKPTIIRLTNCIQEKCIKLENSLETKKLEKEQIEQVLG